MIADVEEVEDAVEPEEDTFAASVLRSFCRASIVTPTVARSLDEARLGAAFDVELTLAT